MDTEWEATFWPIEKEAMRERLRIVGADCIYSERMMRRINFYPPGGDKVPGWIRVRDEGDKVTVSMKHSGTHMDQQKEIQLIVDDFERSLNFLEAMGCKKKNYQETRRELWKLNEVEITIDEWPHLEPFVEVESSSEELVRNVSEALGFDWKTALFCSADRIYAKKYGVESTAITRIPRLVFESPSIPELLAGN